MKKKNQEERSFILSRNCCYSSAVVASVMIARNKAQLIDVIGFESNGSSHQSFRFVRLSVTRFVNSPNKYKYRVYSLYIQTHTYIYKLNVLYITTFLQCLPLVYCTVCGMSNVMKVLAAMLTTLI